MILRGWKFVKYGIILKLIVELEKSKSEIYRGMMMMMMKELRWKVNKPTVFIWLNPIKQIKISKFFQRVAASYVQGVRVWSVILARVRERIWMLLVFDEKVSWWLMWKNLLFHFCGITSTHSNGGNSRTQWTVRWANFFKLKNSARLSFLFFTPNISLFFYIKI